MVAQKQPSINELRELKDQIELFKQNPVWQHILAYMQRLYMDAAEEALNTSATESMPIALQVKWASGIAHAVRMISQFESNIPLLKAAGGVKEDG